VSGSFALLKAQFSTESYLQLINRLLSNTDPVPALSGKCQTGGRLNLQRALTSTSTAPRNDSFASALSIAIPSGKTTITATGNNIDAAKEAGEPNHAGNGGGKSVWWNWTAPNSSPVWVKTKGSSFNTLLAAYTGSSVGSLTSIASSSVSDNCGFSQINFTPSAGTIYRIACGRLRRRIWDD